MIINRENRNILDIREAAGSVHDFKLFKNTIGKMVDPSILIQADLGYLGIENHHANSQIPKKESKYHKLSRREKAYNKRLFRERVVIEHINAKIKTFKSMTYPYRNHCTRHLLRMSLICGIINFELRT
ncbi:IS5 family transposase [Spirochaetia bacterium]|nr:IS5 family transposase [Spirochaetia bacterium]